MAHRGRSHGEQGRGRRRQHRGLRRRGTVTDIRRLADEWELAIDGCPAGRFDVVVGADGHGSTVRGLVDDVAPLTAGYAVLRGTCALDDECEAPAELHRAAVGFPDGHSVWYLIPGLDGSSRRVNWAVYVHPDRLGIGDGRALHPGSVAEQLVARIHELARLRGRPGPAGRGRRCGRQAARRRRGDEGDRGRRRARVGVRGRGRLGRCRRGLRGRPTVDVPPAWDAMDTATYRQWWERIVAG